MRKIQFLIKSLSMFIAVLTVMTNPVLANDSATSDSTTPKTKLSMKPAAVDLERKQQQKALLTLSPTTAVAGDINFNDSPEENTLKESKPTLTSQSSKPTKQYHYVETVKPQKQFSQSVTEHIKPNKVAQVQPEPVKQTKSQQVLLAPIVVLPTQNSSTKDVESRLQLKPKKQQVLHPSVVALASESPKPMLVLQPKVVEAPIIEAPILETRVIETKVIETKGVQLSPATSVVSKSKKAWVKPNKTASFSTTNLSQGKTKAKRKIYQYEQGGITTFSNIVPDSVDFEVLLYDCFACQVNSQVDWHSIPLFTFKHADFVTDAAEQFQLDPALIRAVIHAESAFNAKARSKVGAIGLMQLMPATAKELGVSDAFDIKQNIWGGSQYLAYLLNRFDNDIDLACAAYNAGPTTVTKYQGIPPYPETQAYVERVKILLKRYRAALQS